MDPWMDASVWGKRCLPSEVLQTILAWLPIRSFCRMRCVCREWNSFALDTGFRKIVARTPPPEPFWLVFNLVDEDIVYDSTSGTWHKACSFFYTSDRLSDTSFTKKGMISASGSLLLCSTIDRKDHSMVVFNPVNKTKRWIPRMPRIKHCHTTGILMNKESGSYKIYAVDAADSGSGLLRLQVYDSTVNRWEVTGPLQRDVGQRYEVVGAAQCGDHFYCLTATLGLHLTYQVYRVGPASWEEVNAEMPQKLLFPHLFEYRGHLLLGGGLQGSFPGSKRTLAAVHLWELDSETQAWVNILQMPHELVAELATGHEYFVVANGRYIGVGSRSVGSFDEKIMRYQCNLTTQSWSSLPVPSRNHCRTRQIEVTSTLLFEPRLDVVL